MDTIFETVRENVLWEMLLSKQSYINLVTEGEEEVFEDERVALIEEIEAKRKNYYNKDRSFLVITEYDYGEDKEPLILYSLDNLTGEVSRYTLPLTPDKQLLARQYMALRFKVYWFRKIEGHNAMIETDIEGNGVYDENWNCRLLTIEDNKATFKWVNEW